MIFWDFSGSLSRGPSGNGFGSQNLSKNALKNRSKNGPPKGAIYEPVWAWEREVRLKKERFFSMFVRVWIHVFQTRRLKGIMIKRTKKQHDQARPSTDKQKPTRKGRERTREKTRKRKKLQEKTRRKKKQLRRIKGSKIEERWTDLCLIWDRLWSKRGPKSIKTGVCKFPW